MSELPTDDEAKKDFTAANLIHAVQWGDLAFVESAIDGFGMSPDAKDIDGCSLLHWAAINSRVEIIQYLISKKADTNAVGGTNGETPLQWALRVQACSIAVSLLLAEGADMHHKSAYGCDALFIAVQCSQTNGAFVLLEEGADPNTLDANGDTPMHWLLRRPVGNIALDMLRLLLRFNASVTLRATLDGNNALHLICFNSEAEPYPAELVYFAAAASAELPLLLESANDLGLTPYHAAVNSKNVSMVRFFWDASLYRRLPYWLPVASTAAVGCSFFLCLHLGGWVLGLLCFLPLQLLSEALGQPNIMTGSSRVPTGMALSVIASAMGCYFLTLASLFSFAFNVVAASLSAVILYSFYKACTTVPNHLSPATASSWLVQKILQAEQQERSGSGQQLRLCTSCLVDKSLASLHCSKCNRCVVGVDHHCPFIVNCVGKGNRRIFVLFLFTAALGCEMFACVCVWHMHFRSPCAAADSETWGALLAVQACVGWGHAGFWALTYVSLAVGLWILGLCLNQLAMVAGETTTFEMLKRRNQGIDMLSARGLRNLLRFLASGQYSIAAPAVREGAGSVAGLAASGSGSGCSHDHDHAEHGHAHGHGHGHGEQMAYRV
mmetsp:Transcript_27769/g.61492  ORF Transcript_27769/g.61492 Transcript_27769/m.61492 type:complete len:609 (+) Transcript_27769:163-1989(+)|eukprot:CAMPEP_0173209306 /NCGR_PEP_ID=MMETSP1141-20130122/23023_1 /TAXON_ID=483371 /ORGANISM="non described non described, Strain CCMP2298" /LENGTH=608 /DNA_ID=CAMNT_0014135903 /DNA_START=117 /DNA_END=1943 /DNA_ORIENTATION=-